MKSIDVITFGEVLWDIFETAPDIFHREIGGAPANLAIGLARLGVKSAVIGGVSRDAFGDELVAKIKKSGVDISHIARLPERTGLAFVRRDARGEPSFLFYRHDTADMMLAPKHIAPFDARFAVVGTSTLLFEPLYSATMRFLARAEKSRAVLVVDLNVRKHLWKDPRTMRSRVADLANRAAVIKASRADLDALGGPQFLKKYASGALALILTDGGGTAKAIGPFGEVSARAIRAKCIDATGAGDAFLAGVLAVLTKRGLAYGSRAWNDPAVFSDALAVGHRLGKKVVESVGAVSGLIQLDAEKRMIRGQS